MLIAICDDNTDFMDRLESRIAHYGGEVFKYSSVNALIKGNVVFDIAFIDIEMKDELGFDAARHIFLRNNKCVIAFFTNYPCYTKQGYDFRAFRYILKTEPAPLIQRQIEDVFNEFNFRNKILSGAYKKEKFNICAKDIMYIEAKGHFAYIYTRTALYYMIAPLKHFENELEGMSFIRCHRSFIVNLEYVYSIYDNKNFILFGCGRPSVPIGKLYLKQAKSAYARKFMDGVANDIS